MNNTIRYLETNTTITDTTALRMGDRNRLVLLMGGDVGLLDLSTAGKQLEVEIVKRNVTAFAISTISPLLFYLNEHQLCLTTPVAGSQEECLALRQLISPQYYLKAYDYAAIRILYEH